MSVPNHVRYECSVFSYTAFPTVVVEIDCFRADGSQANCYRYNFTWASADDYLDWLTVAAALQVSGTTAKRLTGMFDALNLFLRIGPLTFGGTTRGAWVRTARFDGPCPTQALLYFTFSETVTPWVDSNSPTVLPFGSFGTAVGKIGSGALYPLSTTNTHTAAAYALDATVSTGVTIWFWFQFNTLASVQEMDVEFFSPSGFLVVTTFHNGGGTALVTVNTNAVSQPVFTTVTAGLWRLLVATWDKATDTIVFYLDNAIIGTWTGGGSSFGTDNYLFQLNNFNGSPDGIVDETGVFWGYAGSTAQVTALWNGGAGVTWPAVSSIFP